MKISQHYLSITTKWYYSDLDYFLHTTQDTFYFSDAKVHCEFGIRETTSKSQELKDFYR